MQILITPAEVLEAVSMYAESKGIQIDPENPIDICPNGSAIVDIDPLANAGTQSISKSAPAEVNSESLADDKADPFAPETTTAPPVVVECWDRENWIKLRKTGFTAYVRKHVDSLVNIDAATLKAIEEKWAKVTDEQFPGSIVEETVEPEETPDVTDEAADASTVGDAMNAATDGDMKEEAPEDLGEEPSEEAGTPEDTESLFG